MSENKLDQISYLTPIEFVAQAERARILAALEKLEHHGTWQDGRPMYWRADEVVKVVSGDGGNNIS